ncbi:MAG TPA: hypothetical protein VHE34_09880 [Puia sp.]|uniref:hypothetical protein n=1 Tax=Puia sp. TaxID=2045100 RepID=UPI002C9574FB|nr:hypothetical protein [Puia sp.]HVU95524.1 hypothetical protein [Puia sp.]
MQRLLLPVLPAFVSPVFAQTPFNGVESNLSNLFRLSPARSRSISPENFNGAKGAGGKATTGTEQARPAIWDKVGRSAPSVTIKAGQTLSEWMVGR